MMWGRSMLNLVCSRTLNLLLLLILAQTDMTQNDHSNLNCALFEGYGLDHVKMEYFSPSIVKGEPYAVDEDYLSDLCRLVTLMMSMSPMSGVYCDMDVEIGITFKGGPFDGAHRRIILFMDPTTWK